jgi:hypothetical protein
MVVCCDILFLIIVLFISAQWGVPTDPQPPVVVPHAPSVDSGFQDAFPGWRLGVFEYLSPCHC